MTRGVSRTELTGEFSWAINGLIFEMSSRSGGREMLGGRATGLPKRLEVEQEKCVEFRVAANVV